MQSTRGETVTLALQKRTIVVAACVLAAGLFFACASASSRRHSEPALYEVLVDGRRIGTTRDPSEVAACAERILAEARTVWPADLEIMSKVECVRLTGGLPAKPSAVALEGDAGEPLDVEGLNMKLGELLQFSAKAFVVQVEGKDIVALRDRSAAESVIGDIRRAYDTKPSRAGTRVKVEDVRILQQVDIAEKRVPVDSLREPEEAAQILLRGTDRIALYTVAKGDSLWVISRANNMTVDQLRRANPQVVGDRLQIGQTLNLVVPEPYVNVVSVEEVTQEIPIPFEVSISTDDTKWPWEQVITQRGVQGRKQVVLEVSRKDGREVARRIVSEKIISEPVIQKLVQGSKLIPDLGTGSYAWPTRGSITSRYGYRRSGFHAGLDIAAPVGTPVIAADSGMVAFAGRLPYYGLVVRVDHGGGKAVTVYGHLSKILVKQGDVIERGQVLGNVGSTGRSTGPHLHFEVRINGSTTDPLRLYPAS